jgi:hypothetical protein
VTDEDFGDYEPADSWDTTTTIAPEQVARRLHRLRRAVELLAGRDPGRWEDLGTDEHDDMLELGAELTRLLEVKPPLEADEIAEELHDQRRILAGADADPEWQDLGDDERALGEALIELIVAWLQREGPRP